MADDRDHPALQQCVQAIFRQKAYQLVGRAGFRVEDAEDLVQNLIIRLHQRLPNIDHTKPEAIANQVAKQGIADELRRRRAAKRDGHPTVSLSTPVNGPDGSPAMLGQVLAADADTRPDLAPGDREPAADLCIDITDFLDSLPAELRHLVQRLRGGDTVAQI